MYAYCLFCETQRCKPIAYLLERYGIADRAFSPQIIKRRRVKGKNVDCPYDLLPGYVFLFSETPLEDFSPFRGITGIIRRIGARLVLLDAALPDPMDTISENYPIIILAILVVIALIVILVSRYRRRKQKKNEGDRPEGSENK